MILLTIVGAVAWPAVRNRRSGEALATLFVCIAKGESPMTRRVYLALLLAFFCPAGYWLDRNWAMKNGCDPFAHS
jgi:hypothetical protein